MSLRKHFAFTCLVLSAALAACGPAEKPGPSFDLLIVGGNVFTGEVIEPPRRADVGVSDGVIAFVGDATAACATAEKTIDASGLVVTAGFIDPHTHSLNELLDNEQRANLNYLFQGVTTVVNGNDGDGKPAIAELAAQLEAGGIGTNTALFAGHGAIRRAVMGGDNRAPTDEELAAMQALLRKAMDEGALGLSTGLFYVPGSFASTDEVVALAEVAAAGGGIYDSHIRDESSYTVGLLAAIDETIEIGRRADIPVHIAHIKALGVDVWGYSDTIVERIERAQSDGVQISADQYPWSASGTHLRNALLPKSFLDGAPDAYLERLAQPEWRERLRPDIAENLRRRGGADALLIVASTDESAVGRTLAEISAHRATDAVDTAVDIMLTGSTRVASFNMRDDDIENFMRQDWVMTSSDGTNGHPRKYASFPRKYQEYVASNPVLTLEEFLYRSSALTADTLGLGDRGRLQVGLAADIIVLNLDNFAPRADFDQWNTLSAGVEYAIVNGQVAIESGGYTGQLPGRFLRQQRE